LAEVRVVSLGFQLADHHEGHHDVVLLEPLQSTGSARSTEVSMT